MIFIPENPGHIREALGKHWGSIREVSVVFLETFMQRFCSIFAALLQ